jgi:predicted HTH domain antitoxin
MNTLSVKFELPTIVASQAGLNLENINQEVKLMFAMFLYEHKRISLSKACEIGGTSQWDFFEANRQLKIPIHYTQDDLKKDMERLSGV